MRGTRMAYDLHISHPAEPMSSLTATVTAIPTSVGRTYVVKLSNGSVVKRSSTREKAAIAFVPAPADLTAGEARRGGGYCTTTTSIDPARLLRETAHIPEMVVVDLRDGRVLRQPRDVDDPAPTTQQRPRAGGRTEAQEKNFQQFCNAPARLEKQFRKSAKYFANFSGDHVQGLVQSQLEAAAFCGRLIGDTATLEGFWNLGMRTSGDLEIRIEQAINA